MRGVTVGDRLQHSVDSHADMAAAWGVAGPYRFVGSSVLGQLHIHRGKPRDDAFAVRIAGPWIAIAVSDGVGSVPYSRYGASCVVEMLCEHLIRVGVRSTPPSPDLIAAARQSAANALGQREAEKRSIPNAPVPTTPATAFASPPQAEPTPITSLPPMAGTPVAAPSDATDPMEENEGGFGPELTPPGWGEGFGSGTIPPSSPPAALPTSTPHAPRFAQAPRAVQQEVQRNASLFHEDSAASQTGGTNRGGVEKGFTKEEGPDDSPAVNEYQPAWKRFGNIAQGRMQGMGAFRNLQQNRHRDSTPQETERADAPGVREGTIPPPPTSPASFPTAERPTSDAASGIRVRIIEDPVEDKAARKEDATRNNVPEGGGNPYPLSERKTTAFLPSSAPAPVVNTQPASSYWAGPAHEDSSPEQAEKALPPAMTPPAPPAAPQYEAVSPRFADETPGQSGKAAPFAGEMTGNAIMNDAGEGADDFMLFFPDDTPEAPPAESVPQTIQEMPWVRIAPLISPLPPAAQTQDFGSLYWFLPPPHAENNKTTPQNEGGPLTVDNIREAFRRAHQGLEQFARSRGASIDDYACTLLGILLNTETGQVAVGHVGDGLTAGRTAGNGRTAPLVEPVRPETFGEVYPFTREDWEEYLAARVLDLNESNALSTLFLMTDGVAEDCSHDDATLSKWGTAMDGQLRDSAEGATAATRLAEYLATYEVPGSYDDRTLVVLQRMTTPGTQ